MKQIELGSNEVICQKWEESERGWGTRPDGFSLHLCLDSLRKYIQKYWDSLPNSVPDEYSRPDGSPYPLGVSDKVFQQVQASDLGLRFWASYEVPGTGGIDGWLPVTER